MWLDLCGDDTIDNADLRLLRFPELFMCPDYEEFNYEDYTESLWQQCHEENQFLADQEEIALFNLQLNDSLNSVQQSYYAMCINHLQTGETFTMTYTNCQFNFTLYFYDQAGNLIKTVPPAGVKVITNSAVLAHIDDYRRNSGNNPDPPDTSPFDGTGFVWPKDSLVTNYKYNSLNQLTLQYTPDGDTVHYYYDQLARLTASQNMEQAIPISSKIRYSYIMYDKLGRAIETGEKSVLSTAPLTKATLNDSVQLRAWLLGGSSNYYIMHTFYDTPLVSISGYNQENLQNRIACVASYGSKPTTLAAWQTPASAYHYCYDVHGNVKSQIQEDANLTCYNWRYIRTDYDYELISGNVKLVKYQHGKNDRFYHKYDYDAENRLIKVQTSNNAVNIGNTSLIYGYTLDAKYFFYPHGSLARVELGDKSIQGVDYAYTINGWLKAINSGTIDTTRDIGADGKRHLNNVGGSQFTNPNKNFAWDAFGYTLDYYNGDFRPIGGTSSPAQNMQVAIPTNCEFYSAIKASGLYNGNIVRTVTSMMQPNGAVPNLMYTAGSAYRYDRLNRLKECNTVLDGTSLTVQSSNSWANITNPSKTYNSYFCYDKNGNIKKLKRYGNNGLMDSLRYIYKDKTNQLIRVNDAVNATAYTNIDIDNQPLATNYSYSRVGNLISDNQGGISSITWNPYGKPVNVNKNTGKRVTFGYDPFGRRTLKYNQTSQVTNFYSYDASGNIMATYEIKAGGDGYKLKLLEQPIYGVNRLGTTVKNIDLSTQNGSCLVTTYSMPIFNMFQYFLCEKQYEISNHLGNVMVTFRNQKIKTGTATNAPWYADVVSASDYYPFGMLEPGRNSFAAGAEYRFGLNGQMKDNDIYNQSGTIYGAEYWEYDSRLARRWNVDPMGLDDESPYLCFANNPIFFDDPLGLEAEHDKRPRLKIKKRRRPGVDNRVRNNQGNVVKNNDFAEAYMDLKDAFSSGHHHRTNLVPAGTWRNNPTAFTAQQTSVQGNQSLYNLNQVNSNNRLRQLWYNGTRRRMFSPAYMDVDALMPGGYRNLFNSNTFAILPDLMNPQGNLRSINGWSQYIGGMNIMFRNGIGMGILGAITSPVTSIIAGVAVALQRGVNPAYRQVRNVRVTSRITLVNNVAVNYQVSTFQYYVNSTNGMGNRRRPRWHRWLFGQPNNSTN